MHRKEENEKILEILKNYLESNPNVRFIQALWALNIIDRKIIDDPAHEIYVPVDRFYEEPNETLKRITRTKG